MNIGQTLYNYMEKQALSPAATGALAGGIPGALYGAMSAGEDENALLKALLMGGAGAGVGAGAGYGIGKLMGGGGGGKTGEKGFVPPTYDQMVSGLELEQRPIDFELGEKLLSQLSKPTPSQMQRYR